MGLLAELGIMPFRLGQREPCNVQCILADIFPSNRQQLVSVTIASFNEPVTFSYSAKPATDNSIQYS